jgi:hypothetical protein
MTSLNLASNMLGPEVAKHVAEAIKVSKCAVAVVLVSVLCPSDQWFNCCCLPLLLQLSAGYGGHIDVHVQW